MADKPSYKMAHKERTGSAEMTIEPAPKTTFSDRDLSPRLSPADPAEKISGENALSGGSISPNPNAPKQTSRGTGSTKPDAEGLTKT